WACLAVRTSPAALSPNPIAVTSSATPGLPPPRFGSGGALRPAPCSWQAVPRSSSATPGPAWTPRGTRRPGPAPGRPGRGRTGHRHPRRPQGGAHPGQQRGVTEEDERADLQAAVAPELDLQVAPPGLVDPLAVDGPLPVADVLADLGQDVELLP